MERERIRRAVEVLWSNRQLDEPGWQASLEQAGYSEVEARLMSSVVPEAFAVAVLEQLGAAMPRTMSVPRRDGGHVEVALAEWPVFSETLAAAREKFRSGPADAVQRMAGRSAAMAAARKALGAEGNLKGASLGLALIGPFAEEIGPLPEASALNLAGAGARRLFVLLGWATLGFPFYIGLIFLFFLTGTEKLVGIALMIPLLIAVALRVRRRSAAV